MELMLENLPLWSIYAALCVLGAAIGSFISLFSHRLPLEEPIGMSRSRCPHCRTALSARDLMPVLSWVLNKGRCRHCAARVSARYPALEVSCALGAAAMLYVFGPSALTLVYVGLWWLAVALIVTDLEHYIILDEVQVAVILLGALHGVLLGHGWADMGLGAATGLGIGLALKYGFLIAAGKDGLGLGDVKFLFAAGIWLADPAAFVPFLFLSGVLGIVSALIWRVLGRGEVFPFGPSLMLALLACVYHPPVAHGFWSLYGFLQH